MKEPKKVIPTPELLQEMEELEILGGDGDVVVHAVVNCESNSFCRGANCVSGCACQTIQPQPGTNKLMNCGD